MSVLTKKILILVFLFSFSYIVAGQGVVEQGIIGQDIATQTTANQSVIGQRGVKLRVLSTAVQMAAAQIAVAQEVPVTDSAEEQSEPILQKQRLEKEISNLKKQYIGQMEEYLQQERSYEVAKDQYLRHQTLSSIEEAVNQTRAVMKARSQVLTTYLQLIKLKLIEAEGIEVTQKTKALNYLDLTLDKLAQHQVTLDQISTRDQVSAAAAEFVSLEPEIENTSYYGLSLLAVGKLQSTFDQARALEKKVTAANFEPDTLIEQSEQARAVEETNKIMSQVQTELAQQWELLAQLEPEAMKYQVYYRSLFEELTPVYARLSQLVSYLDELMDYGQK
ncbi:MAG: hypothetical protein GF381_01430 [Candidatus Pacebacteria bacterium]|nr:hypothetical protein [Candidatus Paceibacterota bacterium]